MDGSTAAEPVVGREVELARLAGFVAAPGRARGLTIVGDAGIGKTTVWESGLAAARADGLRVLVTRASETELQLSFVALADLLDDVDTAAVDDVPAPQRHALEVAILRAEPDAAPPEPLAVAAGFTRVLRRLAGHGPVVVAIDDAPWLDRASQDALAFAVRRLRGHAGHCSGPGEGAGQRQWRLRHLDRLHGERCGHLPVDGRLHRRRRQQPGHDPLRSRAGDRHCSGQVRLLDGQQPERDRTVERRRLERQPALHQQRGQEAEGHRGRPHLRLLGQLGEQLDRPGHGGQGAIGRANLDGTGVIPVFVSVPGSPQGLAVDANFIYWADVNGQTIGRANLDGSSPNPSFISSTYAVGPVGVAVNATSVYWTNSKNNTIGRANLDGSSPVANLIVNGVAGPQSIAVDSRFIYWANGGTNAVVRTNLDGSSPLPIQAGSVPFGVAVDAA